jgi:RNA polymerase sigma-70 factor (ECF subfamily)
MRHLSDEQLMHRYAADDLPAFEVLYERYRGPLYRYLARQVREEALANDLYQGVWEKIIGARKTYRPSAPFKAWAFRIAHNHLVDHYRQQRPATSLEQAGFIGVPGEQEELAEQQQRKAALETALAALPEEQRLTIMLRLEGGFDLDQIAKLTDVGRETAKSRLRYATAKLKQVMGS